MPENDDRVDPKFNFISEEHTKDRNPVLDDVYAHEIYNKPNCDGVLISKINIDQSTKRKDQILNAGGLHKFLRLPLDIPLYGDCGAFSYIQDTVPPYETDEILEYYQQLDFDIGTSIDHLIIGKMAEDEELRNFRYNLTLRNARDFIEKHKQGNYTFTPSGVAQGWDADSYYNSVKELIDMGYSHISLGGLARTPSGVLLEILQTIAPIIPDYLEVHLLGAARLEYLDVFHKLGVTSFDSTTFLKKAWASASGGNYFTKNRKKYAAIRIPQADVKKNARAKEIINRGVITIDELVQLEQNSLQFVRDFDKGNSNLEDAVETVLKYDSYFETLKDYKQKYKKMKEVRDRYVSGKLNIDMQELTNIEKGIMKEMKDVAKLHDILEFDNLQVGDIGFNSFVNINKSVIKSNLDEEACNFINKVALYEKEIIEAENLFILDSTLKDYFKENYDRVFNENKLRPLYQQVLLDKPWKNCDCTICDGIGVEVIIFRGNNRNRRRGFHNTFVFYNQLQEIVN
nr:tRNA-guanine transglycosylase DpdA [Halobacillus sp. GSS1]